MNDVRQLEDAKSQALRKKWAYVARLCREAAEAASVEQDPAKVRRLLIRAAKHTAQAEQLARIVQVGVVQGHVIQGRVLKELTPGMPPARTRRAG